MKTGKPTITAHCLVKNEENFIWYAVNAVLPYVDKMIIFDTGSSDRTVEIIREILETPEGKRKIHFEEKGEVDKQGHTDLRNKMIEMTETDWFIVLDGDEVWPETQIKYLIEKDLENAERTKKNCVMVSFHLCSGDLHHYTERGHFGAPWGLHGQFAFRCFRKRLNLSWRGEYLKDVPKYENNRDVITQENILFSTTYFWHLSKLPRSSEDRNVFERSKPSRLNFLPQGWRRFFVKKYQGELPSVFLKKGKEG